MYYNITMYQIPRKRLILFKLITLVIIPFAVFWTLVAGFNIFYTRAYVNGLSMHPTLNNQLSTTNKRDVIYIDNFADVSKNDIIVMDLRAHPDFKNYTIKRLIATAGDVVTIDIQNDCYELRVNNQLIYTKDLNNGLNTYTSFNQYIQEHIYQSSRILRLDNGVYGVKVNEGEIFVLGDNWNVSKDSSLVGPINEKSVIGKVRFIINPNENEFISILKSIF